MIKYAATRKDIYLRQPLHSALANYPSDVTIKVCNSSDIQIVDITTGGTLIEIGTLWPGTLASIGFHF